MPGLRVAAEMVVVPWWRWRLRATEAGAIEAAETVARAAAVRAAVARAEVETGERGGGGVVPRGLPVEEGRVHEGTRSSGARPRACAALSWCWLCVTTSQRVRAGVRPPGWLAPGELAPRAGQGDRVCNDPDQNQLVW